MLTQDMVSCYLPVSANGFSFFVIVFSLFESHRWQYATSKKTPIWQRYFQTTWNRTNSVIIAEGSDRSFVLCHAFFVIEFKENL